MRTRRPAGRPKRRAITLVEVLIALVVVVFGMYAVLDLLQSNQRNSEHAHSRIQAIELARAKMAEIQAVGYETFEPMLPKAADAPSSPILFPKQPAGFEAPYEAKAFLWQARLDRSQGQPEAINVEIRVFWPLVRKAPEAADVDRSVALGGLLVRKEKRP